MECNILIVGVGGQGTLLASNVLGALGKRLGVDVKLSEVHGMSQRGGSVVTHVRMGEKIYSPVIEEGTADIVLAFEKLEAFRFRHYLKKDGTILVNLQEMMPMPVITGDKEYPDRTIEKMREEGLDVREIEGLRFAREAGNTKAVNTVMLGALSKILNVKYEDMEAAMVASVPQKLVDVNKTALKLGYENY